jgi:hypothetical protein
VNLLGRGQVDTAATEMADVHLAYEGSLGPRHPYALACVNNRAIVSRAADDLRLARSLASEASRGMSEAMGADHPYTLAALSNLAVLLAEDGERAAARKVVEGVADRPARVLGSDHPDTALWNVNLALMGDGPLPDTAASGVLDRLATTLGPDHPAVLAARRRTFLHRTLDPHPF